MFDLRKLLALVKNSSSGQIWIRQIGCCQNSDKKSTTNTRSFSSWTIQTRLNSGLDKRNMKNIVSGFKIWTKNFYLHPIFSDQINSDIWVGPAPETVMKKIRKKSGVENQVILRSYQLSIICQSITKWWKWHSNLRFVRVTSRLKDAAVKAIRLPCLALHIINPWGKFRLCWTDPYYLKEIPSGGGGALKIGGCGWLCEVLQVTDRERTQELLFANKTTLGKGNQMARSGLQLESSSINQNCHQLKVVK